MSRHPFQFVPPPSSESGFTVLELLITMVVLAILGATAMPIMANQTEKARSVEAKTNLAVIDRAQEAHYLERGQFAHTLQQLDVKITPKAFQYSVIPTSTGMMKHRAINAPSQPSTLKEYVSGVWFHHQQFGHVICESKHHRHHPNFLSPDIDFQTTAILCLHSKPLG